ncbi:hypothetical protein TNCV_136231 [Trichonephila clavipes]|nr:hypothetical protein TNCV_136231 [Trichonephila clavipes]
MVLEIIHDISHSALKIYTNGSMGVGGISGREVHIKIPDGTVKNKETPYKQEDEGDNREGTGTLRKNLFTILQLFMGLKCPLLNLAKDHWRALELLHDRHSVGRLAT